MRTPGASGQATVVPRWHTEQLTVHGQDHDLRPGIPVSHRTSRPCKVSAYSRTSRDRRHQPNGQQLVRLAGRAMGWAGDAG
ncbi:hypothetical protein [Streptomyces sp. NBC_00212]|uniref:hypothetical protein n=1 Tax=Streptomyces sp. NBC_00212 TaxID=2975684 RepID=UPI003248F010